MLVFVQISILPSGLISHLNSQDFLFHVYSNTTQHTPQANTIPLQASIVCKVGHSFSSYRGIESYADIFLLYGQSKLPFSVFCLPLFLVILVHGRKLGLSIMNERTNGVLEGQPWVYYRIVAPVSGSWTGSNP